MGRTSATLARTRRPDFYLARTAAHAARSRGLFPGGVIEVDVNDRGIDPVAVAEEALGSALNALDVPDSRIPESFGAREALYRGFMARRAATLLILDNVEQAQVVRLLSPGASRHQIIVTARHPMVAFGEVGGAAELEIGALSPEDAEELLRAGIQRRSPQDPRLADADGIRELVQRLGGIPLAIELAAGLLTADPERSVQDLVGSLDAADRELHSDGSEATRRTVRSVLDAAFTRLPEDQRRLLMLLTVNAPWEFSTATAAALTGATPEAARVRLTGLAEHSLVSDLDSGRWTMHDLIRSYGRSRAAETIPPKDLQAAADRIIDFYLASGYTVAADHSPRTARVGARRLPGVHSDSPSEIDLLGIGPDVEVLGELIAAADTRPPLAIALIGDWGAGKSTLMRHIEEHVELLARLSGDVAGDSAFVSSVLQIRFNAWHYSDQHIWVGLISHLFAALSGVGEPGAAARPQQPASPLAQREILRADLESAEAEAQRLSEKLESVESARPPAEPAGVLDSPAHTLRVLRAAVKQLARDPRAGISLAALWLAIAGIATAIWLARGRTAGEWTGLIAALSAIAAPVRPLLRRARQADQSLLGHVWARQEELTRDLAFAQAEVVRKREQLAVLDAAARLGAFIEDRARSDDYQALVGVLGHARADLERLSGELAAAREQWKSEGAASAPPLERIVLYIDDLDRCPPGRVVQVLQAVHLMLGLDLFVVVVAVDARWLVHSLQQHHDELFRRDETEQRHHGPGDGRDGLATPIDYLDKIFQVPYALASPTSATMGGYLRALFATDEPAPAKPNTSERTGADAAVPERLSNARQDDRPPPIGAATVQDAGEAHTNTRARASAPVERTWHPHPSGLRIGTDEIGFMAGLSPLLPTPRAAKRLANLYRLVRIGIPATDLPAFSAATPAAPFKAVQILLALLVGSPTAARSVFEGLVATSDDAVAITDFLAAHGSVLAVPAFRETLHRLEESSGIPPTVDHYRRWCPELARYSFHTRALHHHSRLPSAADHDGTPASQD